MNQKQMDSVAAHLGGGRPNFSVELMVRHNRTANAFNRPNDPETPSGSRATQLATQRPKPGIGRRPSSHTQTQNFGPSPLESIRTELAPGWTTNDRPRPGPSRALHVVFAADYDLCPGT